MLTLMSLNSVRRVSVVRAAKLWIELLSHVPQKFGTLEVSSSVCLWAGDSDGRAEIGGRPIRFIGVVKTTYVACLSRVFRGG